MRIFGINFGKKEVQNSISSSQELFDFLVQGYGYETAAGVNLTPERAMTIAAAQAAVRVLSEGVAQLPLIIYSKSERGREPSEEHPLWNLLTIQPNDFQNAFEFWEMAMIHLCLHGNYYAFKNSPTQLGGKIVELLPIHPNRVVVEQDVNYNVLYKVNLPNGKEVTLTKREIFHIKDGSVNGYIGRSRVVWMKEALGLALRAEAHGAKVFGNGGRPSGLLSATDKLTKEQMDQIRESWKAAHGGENVMGTAVVDGGMKFTPLSYNSKDTQFIESRKFQIEEVARVFRVPPHMLMLMDKATFSNIEHQSLEFVKFSLTPWLRRIEMAIKTQLLEKEKFSKFSVAFDERQLLRGDLKSRGEFYGSMITNKIMTRNECREMEGLNKVEGGDVFENPNITPGDGTNANDKTPAEQNNPK